MKNRCSVVVVAEAPTRTAEIVLQLVRRLEITGAVDLEVCTTIRKSLMSDADIVHTIGTPAAALEWASAVPARGVWVHTVDHLDADPRRIRGRHGWALRQRRGLSRPSKWLAHGRAASRTLVNSGIAQGERVICLPLLPSVFVHGAAASRAAGLAWRRDQGIAAGMRVIAGVGAPDAASGCLDIDDAMARFDPRSTMAVWVATGPRLRRPSVLKRVSIVDVATTSAATLAAADAIVAVAHRLDATTAAAFADASGAPLVAASSDSACELVIPGLTGTVVPPSRPDALAGALHHVLDRGPVMRRAMSGQVELSADRLSENLFNAYGMAAEWAWHSTRTFSTSAP